MKVMVNVWRRRAALNVAACLLIWAAVVTKTQSAFLGPSDRPEAYFNGSSYIRLSRPISLKQLVGLSYRTCVGGGLFSQRFEGYTLHVTALFEQVVVSWARPGASGEAAMRRETLDNKWHWIALRYRPNPPALILQLDKETQVISNATLNAELLSPGALEAGGAVVLVGNVFSGCLHEGPQLEFHHHAQLHNVEFGHCPLATDDCIERKDVLRKPPKDHCYNEPCMRHGTCISRHDRYECHCTPRYTGNNCEVDAGSVCRSQPCRHGGVCQEDERGDYSCDCPIQYHGPHCEWEVSLDPQCVAGPCRNNGSCSVPPNKDTYICTCAPGYTGRNCELDIDECSSVAVPCLNGGRCVDAVNNYTCDCDGTGYTGSRCEVNINECEEERNICGHGACYDTYGGYVCACAPPYSGEHCHKKSLCAGVTCAEGWCSEEAGGCVRRAVRCGHACPTHAHCGDAGLPNMVTGVVVNKQPTCVCDHGYYGAAGVSPNCSLPESACEAGVCLNGATCLQAPEHFNCSCAPGFKGVYCEAPEPGVGGVPGGGGAMAELRTGSCAGAPCLHAHTCTDTTSGFRCECEAGWAGVRCEVPAGGGAGAARELVPDCRLAGCAQHQECAESPGGLWSCAGPGAGSPCLGAPCHNGTCLAPAAGLLRCLCLPGYTGRFCETDIDECASSANLCMHGVCVNLPGSYQCYCKPGYTGDSCEQDIDECLSSPCKNGGTCQNLENNYECACVDGFTGKDCAININECESSPCAAGSTCVDGIATYSCVCQQGLTGVNCEIDIDDCQSSPCLHGGRCVDGVNRYTCVCAGTGYSGPRCDTNIDECASQPCRHGAPCRDDLNDYECACLPGYTGKNCEIDINECESSPCLYEGVCLEHSNQSLYRGDSAPLQVGPQPHMLLPQLFYQPFSYENASGYSCVCVSGTLGPRCATNVDECAAGPCAHGACVDLLGAFRCDCAPGWEGPHCAIEIDECQRYTPCVNGKCYDGRASYYCSCHSGWGGRNCSVELRGCRGAPCTNHGSCRPWLQGETVHRFNCSCTPGHHGTTCEKITTMSLEKNSYAEVNTTREEGYDISFRFKTTLGSGLLAMGRGLTYFFLELSNGRLNLHSSLLNKWEGVFIGSNLNDSNWQKVFVTINSSHVVLAANEEQTIYPISQNEAYNSSVTSFPSTRLGAPGSSYATLTHGPHFFVGCFQDVVVNNQWVLPEESNTSEWSSLEEGEISSEDPPDSAPSTGARVVVSGVSARCGRVPQCSPNPCRSGGACSDQWSSFTCACPRPHLGDTCQYNYTAATFGHESAVAPGLVAVAVAEASRRAVHAALDISMFIRTRKPTGHIFYLGSLPRYGQTDETSVGASLKGGELLVHLRFNQTPEDYTVGGTRLDNGHLHLIQVVRNATLVQVKLNGTEYFRKSISAAKQLDAQVLYLGGPPPPAPPPSSPSSPSSPAPSPSPSASPSPLSSSLAPATTTTEPVNDDDYFKGVIQDVQISNGVNVTVVEMFPLVGVATPPAFGAVRLSAGGGVVRGEVSDDKCRELPCHHHAQCTNTWNDYICACPRGYKGKNCAEVEFCQLQGCPLNSHCRNLDLGYECVSNATFDGVNTTLGYKFRIPEEGGITADNLEPPDSITITYRSKVGGTLLYAESTDGAMWVSVGVFNGRAGVWWWGGGVSGAVWRGGQLLWTTLRLALVRRHTPRAMDHLIGSFIEADGHEEIGFTAAIDVASWQKLLMYGNIYLGGFPADRKALMATTTMATVQPETSTDMMWEYTEGDDFPTENMAGKFFKGCIGEVHIGPWLLPFFTEEQLFVGAPALRLPRAHPHYALMSGEPWGFAEGVGCVLCVEADCARGGRCEDVRTSYTCACAPGRAGDYCEIDLDECETNQCQNGATCKDGVAMYTCICPDGFEGQYCETDIDSCSSSPCLHGGSCTDLPGGYSCSCAAGWGGDSCAERKLCPPHACHRGDCVPRPDPVSGNNYTCECEPGWAGVHCELAYCQVKPCLRGDCLTNTTPPMCACPAGYTGPHCEAQAWCGAEACEHGRCVDDDHPHCDCEGTGWQGLRCEQDVDECSTGEGKCGPGDCINLPGGYTCNCSAGFCGENCALRDPCVPGAVGALGAAAVGASGAVEGGPCGNGGRCEARCGRAALYLCHCEAGWSGANCTEQVSVDAPGPLQWSWGVWWGVGGALLALCVCGGAGALLAGGARRGRATRGTYSPSGQEYCNPRAEHKAGALKPPPEERLI